MNRVPVLTRANSRKSYGISSLSMEIDGISSLSQVTSSLLVNHLTLSNALREGGECGPCLRTRLARWYSGLSSSECSALSTDRITRTFRPEPSQRLSSSHALLG